MGLTMKNLSSFNFFNDNLKSIHYELSDSDESHSDTEVEDVQDNDENEDENSGSDEDNGYDEDNASDEDNGSDEDNSGEGSGNDDDDDGNDGDNNDDDGDDDDEADNSGDESIQENPENQNELDNSENEDNGNQDLSFDNVEHKSDSEFESFGITTSFQEVSHLFPHPNIFKAKLAMDLNHKDVCGEDMENYGENTKFVKRFKFFSPKDPDPKEQFSLSIYINSFSKPYDMTDFLENDSSLTILKGEGPNRLQAVKVFVIRSRRKSDCAPANESFQDISFDEPIVLHNRIFVKEANLTCSFRNIPFKRCDNFGPNFVNEHSRSSILSTTFYANFKDSKDFRLQCSITYVKDQCQIVQFDKVRPRKLSETVSPLSSDLRELLSSGKNTDVTFQLAGEEVKAHKVILSARVPYFDNMFSSGMLEAESGIISIMDDVDVNAFMDCLYYIYSGLLPKTLDLNCQGLLLLADKYDIAPIKDACSERLLKSLTKDNLIQTLVLSDLYHCKNLKICCISKFFEWKELIPKESFQLLIPYPTLMIEILSS